MSIMKQVFVFRTSVSCSADIKLLKPVLDHLVEQDGRWNFDLHDWENILRVETAVCKPVQVIEALQKKAHYCEELE
jgi:hypothetical protein